MKLKGLIFMIAVILVGGIFFIKIFPKDQEEVLVPEKEDDKILIGFSMSSIVIDRWQRDRDVFVATAKELGAEVIVKTANEDNETQIRQIEDLIRQGVDVLVITPDDKGGLVDVVKKAKDQGIEVIAYDRSIADANADVYLSFDNVKLGRLMGETMLEYVPNGNYVIINGSIKDYNSSMYNEGFHEALDKAAEDKKINIIKEVWGPSWQEQIVYDTIEEVLRSGEKIDAIIAANDRFAEAAIQVLAENRQAGQIAVIGHDSELSACQRIVEGTQLATIYKSINSMAEGAAKIAIDLANGKEIQTEHMMNDGTYLVPRVVYDVFIVTKENMVEIIVKNGFHRIEDIYQNIPTDQWPDYQE